MISVTNAGQMINGRQYVELSGLSTDEKTTHGVLNGSSFFEMDTGNVYFFDEENDVWLGGDEQ